MNRFKPHIALLICNIVWAMDYPFYNIVLPRYVHPMAMVSGSLIATALFSLVPLLWQKAEKVEKADVRKLIGAALLIGVLRKVFIMYGLSMTSPIDGSIIDTIVPLLVLLLFGIFIVVITLLYFGPAMNKGSWFERALFVFGYSTGVFAIGFILLRIVDPENKSLTLNDTAFACIFTTFSELFTWSFGPMMLLNGQHWLFIGIQLAIMAVCIIVNLVMKWWWIKLPLTRPAVGEDEG